MTIRFNNNQTTNTFQSFIYVCSVVNFMYIHDRIFNSINHVLVRFILLV